MSSLKHTRRMVLIPEDTWLAAQAEKRQQRLLKSNLFDQKRVRTLQDMDEILKDSSRPFQEREREYDVWLQQTLEMQDRAQAKPTQSLQTISQATVSPPEPPVQNDTHVLNEVIQTVPKTLQAKATQLMNRIKAHPNLGWDAQGQLMVEGFPQHGTHMVDLINDLVRQRVKASSPRGWNVLGPYLAASNVPRELIGNSKRWQWLQSKADQTSVSPVAPSRKADFLTPPESRPNSVRRWLDY